MTVGLLESSDRRVAGFDVGDAAIPNRMDSRMVDHRKDTLVTVTAELVGAYVSNNSVPLSDLPALISDVFVALSKVGEPTEVPAPQPAVNPRKSVFPDYIISLEDGKRYKALKRHLTTRGITPNEYREKWKLPKDYPMTSASYTAQRSALAKSLGLGKKAGARTFKTQTGTLRKKAD